MDSRSICVGLRPISKQFVHQCISQGWLPSLDLLLLMMNLHFKFPSNSIMYMHCVNDHSFKVIYNINRNLLAQKQVCYLLNHVIINKNNLVVYLGLHSTLIIYL